jgi:hypothetical protein
MASSRFTLTVPCQTGYGSPKKSINQIISSVFCPLEDQEPHKVKIFDSENMRNDSGLVCFLLNV